MIQDRYHTALRVSGSLAQLVEQLAFNQLVGGSSPPRPTISLALAGLLAVSVSAQAETIPVQIKGFDDGVKSSQQTDYQEAVLFAKREAIERAGVSIKSTTTIENFQVESDYIESQAEAVLLPGYEVLDIGYQEDGAYLVVLTGEVALSESADEQPPSPLIMALNALSDAPETYQWDIGIWGSHDIEKAYFAGNDTFVIHYDYNNGVMTLENVSSGNMMLNGAFVTSADKGKGRLVFNEDGTAEGEWRNLLGRGKITIRRKES